MTIQKLQSGKLLIRLKNEELERYGLDFRSLDEDDDHTKRFLRRLVIASASALPRRQRGYVVEALPGCGECLIVISPMQQRRTYRIKRIELPAVWRFDTVDDLLDAYRLITDAGRRITPKAQILEGAVLLCFHYPPTPKQERLLSEYGVRMSPIGLAACREYQAK